MLTVVSANYIPAARVLCRSFAEHHPDVRRFVLLVDKLTDGIVPRNEPFELVRLEDLGIPDLSDFLAQYTVIEANTAVKPYALRHLFERYKLDKLLYLDPDILIAGRLDAVWNALDSNSIVVTPHMREPFSDNHLPAEIDILRCGTYNLGFIGLRQGESARRLLDWWADKTEYDCVIDLPSGLFVDQKWMDLVPGYFGDTCILRDPAYNTAYWNLHERSLTYVDGQYLVDGLPLKFFHFSGYEPHRPTTLSKHQRRHDLRSMRSVRRLCDEYGKALFDADYDAMRRKGYGYDKLSNGVPIAQPLRHLVRYSRKYALRCPSVTDADAFCRFMLTPNAEICGKEIPPLSQYIFERRPDVVAAFPRAPDDLEDAGFIQWLELGSKDYDCDLLYRRFKSCLLKRDVFTTVARIYDLRLDLQRAFPDAFTTFAGLEGFASWLVKHGLEETTLTRPEIDEFVEAGRTGFHRVLEYYLSTPELHPTFPLALLPGNDDFVAWMMRNGMRLAAISPAEIMWFQRRLEREDANVLLLFTALRNSWVQTQVPLGTTALGWSVLCAWARSHARHRGRELPFLTPDPPAGIPFLDQLETLHVSGSARGVDVRAFRSAAGVQRVFDAASADIERLLSISMRRSLAAAVFDYAPSAGVNVAGYFQYAAGAGSAATALTQALDAVAIVHEDVAVPVAPSKLAARVPARKGLIPEIWWRGHRPDFDTTITVINADALPAAHAYLGRRIFNGRRHIGYWVWETEELPGIYVAAAEGIDAIWTPTAFSARALRATLGRDVRVEVVPYAVPVAHSSEPRKLPIALPEDRTLFGFYFDMRSVVERKNPAAVLEAFRKAFRNDDRATLVLKVNNVAGAHKEMAKLERLAEGLPVVWIRDVRLDPFEMRALTAKLDVYVSLHRAEGFGLTIAEAMAAAKPVIATGYSGNLEFMNDDCARLVRHETVRTEKSFGPYPRGTRWAQPDIAHAASLMRELHRDAGLRKELGRRAQKQIETVLAPWVVGRTVKALLSGTPPRDPPLLGSEHRAGAE
jgi:glycosyltransferase involved in cell wall biosynthesis